MKLETVRPDICVVEDCARFQIPDERRNEPFEVDTKTAEMVQFNTGISLKRIKLPSLNTNGGEISLDCTMKSG